jgi:hypothetical protein
VVWPLIPVMGLHGARAVRRGLVMRWVIARSASASSSLARWTRGSSAAPTEVQHRRRTFSGDVEAVGIVVHRGVAVGGGGVGDDECACRDEDVT